MEWGYRQVAGTSCEPQEDKGEREWVVTATRWPAGSSDSAPIHWFYFPRSVGGANNFCYNQLVLHSCTAYQVRQWHKAGVWTQTFNFAHEVTETRLVVTCKMTLNTWNEVVGRHDSHVHRTPPGLESYSWSGPDHEKHRMNMKLELASMPSTQGHLRSHPQLCAWKLIGVHESILTPPVSPGRKQKYHP